ncbi:hypothetical protein C8K15_11658 [Paenisporosarcina sp. OV554]|nr:hypothetical protein C8K15_11658 [Paenisporosarcina sp. OV554]
MDDVFYFFENFIFWYLLIICWILLSLSVLFFIIALIKKSRLLMGISVAFMLPNILLLFIQEIEKVLLYLFILWFTLQIFMLIKLFRNEKKSF